MGGRERRAADVALVTSEGFPSLTEEDRLLAEALARRGLDAQPRIWTDPSIEWGAHSACVIRSAWDYHLRRDEFVAWAERTSRVTRLWNPAPILAWNTEKSYLLQMAARGARIVPTVWLPRGASIDLKYLSIVTGFRPLVLKPAIAAGGAGACRMDDVALSRGQAHLDALLASGDALAQPYFRSVEAWGERSITVIDGEPTHVVHRSSGFAIGSAVMTSAPRAPSAEELAIAREVLQRVDGSLLYARIDLIPDADGALHLLELELVEPMLHMRRVPSALERFADAIASRCRA